MLPNPWVILIVGAVFLASVGGAGWKGYSLGVQHEQVKAAAERDRIAKVNSDALEESRIRIAALNAEIEKGFEDDRRFDDEAAADPAAGRICIGVDGVRRLNAPRR